MDFYFDFKKNKTLIIIWVVYLFGLIYFLLYKKSVLPIYIILPIIVFIVANIASTQQKKKQEFFQQFAEKNNFKYYFRGSLEELRSPIFNLGDDQRIENLLKGQLDKYPIALGVYKYNITQGKHNYTYFFTTAILTLNNNLPHIFLKNNKHNFSKDIIDTDANFKYLQLEGNFNQYFTLLTEKNYERETLQILTPDVMSDLIDKAGNVSLEIIQNELYFYTPEIFNNSQNILSFLSTIIHFTKKIDPALQDIDIKI